MLWPPFNVTFTHCLVSFTSKDTDRYVRKQDNTENGKGKGEDCISLKLKLFLVELITTASALIRRNHGYIELLSMTQEAVLISYIVLF